jgi:hypothetical protein
LRHGIINLIIPRQKEKGMNKRLVLAVINLIGLTAVIVVNALAVILPLNGNTTEQLSDMYPNLFVPAGLTFSIWGVIYLLLAIFCIYSFLPSVQRNAARGGFIERIGLLFAVSCLLNIGWIIAWHYEFVALSVVIMLGLLLTLVAIYLRLNIGNSAAPAGERYLVHVPFSVYLGWISVATIANITALLVSLNWDGFGLSEPVWTVTVMIVAIVLALIMLAQRRDIFYALVVDWALLGILLKRMAVDSQPDQYVGYAAIAGTVIISAGILLRVFKRSTY